MKQRERYLQLVLLCVVVILGVLGCLAFLKFRNSVRVNPSKEYSVDEQVVLYRQDDEEHIIEFEFSGILDELFYLNIDG